MMRVRRLVVLVLLLATTQACNESVDGPSGTTDSIPPVITALEPSPNARDVPETAVITVRFSEPINPATVGPASFLLRQALDTVIGTYAFGDSSMSFVPDGPLPFLTGFSVTVTRGIRDPAGNQLGSDTAWGFHTIGQDRPAGAASVTRRYRTTLRSTNHTFAGRSASRRMYHRNQALP